MLQQWLVKMSDHGGGGHAASEAANSTLDIFSIMDSSRVSTFFISILLIVYGSFRSLAMEDDNNSDEDNEDNNDKKGGGSVQTLDSWQALCLPLGASISLLVMFFFFDSMQILFAICTAVIATVALAFLLLPMCQYFLR